MSRVNTLSSKYFRIYKIFLVVLVTALVVAYLLPRDLSITGLLISLFYVALLIKFWFPSFFKMLKSFKEVSYDQSSLYVKHRDYEIQVPFERIRNVELKSLDGLYRFELIDEDQFGKYIYCKPSLWYPFNYTKVDDELDRIRKMISKRKQEKYDKSSSTQLNSINN